jgi:methylmalonyl-CoA mutase cobalamin-binding subunit
MGHDNSRKFLHIPFANKGIDAINISNILNRKEYAIISRVNEG